MGALSVESPANPSAGLGFRGLGFRVLGVVSVFYSGTQKGSFVESRVACWTWGSVRGYHSRFVNLYLGVYIVGLFAGFGGFTRFLRFYPGLVSGGGGGCNEGFVGRFKGFEASTLSVQGAGLGATRSAGICAHD